MEAGRLLCVAVKQVSAAAVHLAHLPPSRAWPSDACVHPLVHVKVLA
jgi:hypothetical protein